MTLGVPKLEMYMCPSQCPICACPVYKLGHSLYTGATAWAFLVHYTGAAWILLAHYTGTTWVLLVHIQYNNLGTLSTLQGYCFGTTGTLEVHAWVFLALACPPLVHYLKSYTCAL